MNIFQWEDGTVVERPYVEIDGTKYYVQNGTVSGGTPATATNMNEMQNILNNNISNSILNATNWNYLGITTGANTINLPSSFKELLCIILINNNGNLSFEITIPYASLDYIPDGYTSLGFNNGYYGGSGTQSGFCRIQVNKATAYLSNAYSNTTDVINDSKVLYFYR